MNKNSCIGLLIVCFASSSVQLSLATEVVGTPPIIVQPYDVQALNQQMLNRDRMNRDEEVAIQGLIENNDKLTQNTLARQEDEGLQKINQTMLSYRNTLYARDQARIAANGQRWSSRYGDLIALTEDADAMTVDRGWLEGKNDLIAQKYKMLSDLKDEMTALNDKLSDQHGDALNQKQTVIEGYKKIAQEQQDKIQTLVDRLGEMDRKIAHFDEIIAQKEKQIALLKDNLSAAQGEISSRDGTIKAQQDQIAILQQQAQSLSIKEEHLKSQADQIDSLDQQPNDHTANSDNSKAEVNSLKSRLQEQANELKAKDELINNQNTTADLIKTKVITLKSKVKDQLQAQSDDLKAKEDKIHWLNQVLAAAKNKADYYQLTSKQDQLSLQQVKEEVQRIKDDFRQHFKNNDQLEGIIASLKEQVAQVKAQLSQKQAQVDLLKSELENKITESKTQAQQEAETEQDLKTQLQHKQDQVVKMRADIKTILQGQTNDDRLKLAKQLIDLHQEEASLLDEKSTLVMQQFPLLDGHVGAYEKRMKVLLADHRVQDIDLKDQLEGLKNDLAQNQQEIDSLKGQLEEKINDQKDQEGLQRQIRDLKTQLHYREDQIATLKAEMQRGQGIGEDVESLKQEAAAQQDKMNLLKQQLDTKIAESDKMTLMMADYQKKLEAKNNAYNEQLLSSKNDQAQTDKQIAYLNAQLQEKESQSNDLQAKDLSLSMVQEKTTDQKIKEYHDKINGLQSTSEAQTKEITDLKTELALAQQRLNGMPSSDEIEFLRAGLQKATAQLKQKEEELGRIKTNADEYSKEFKSQTQEFQSLKSQLQNTYDEIHRRTEDLKYKDMEITRLKERSVIKEGDLQDQIDLLTQKLEGGGKKIKSNIHENENPRGNNLQALEAKLSSANLQIKDLQAQLNQFTAPSKSDPVREKLKQALDKIDEQGRIISRLAQKLQEAGQTVDLTRK